MTYFKDEYGNVYDDDDLVDYIESNVFSEDDFESYLNDSEDTVTICGRDYDPGETLHAAYPSDFDMEYRDKLSRSVATPMSLSVTRTETPALSP